MLSISKPLVSNEFKNILFRISQFKFATSNKVSVSLKQGIKRQCIILFD